LIKSEQRYFAIYSSQPTPNFSTLQFNEEQEEYGVLLEGVIIAFSYPNIYITTIDDIEPIFKFIIFCKIKWIDIENNYSSSDLIPIQNFTKAQTRLSYYSFTQSQTNPKYYRATPKKGMEVKKRLKGAEFNFNVDVVDCLPIAKTISYQIYNFRKHCFHFILDCLYNIYNINKLANLEKKYKFGDIYHILRHNHIRFEKRIEHTLYNVYREGKNAICLLRHTFQSDKLANHICLIYNGELYEIEASLLGKKLEGFRIVDQYFIKSKK
jgi:hypothetical protein